MSEETDSKAQIVMFGGKGGVGKTTCASATGLALAKQGNRTLLVSTDPAHSTGDVFDIDIGDEPTELMDNLYGVEINPVDRFGRRYSNKLKDILNKAKNFGIDIGKDDVEDVNAKGVIPGADELAVIDLFAEYAESDEWDAVVFDTAPTGHTLRMLQLPEVAGETLSKVVKIKAGVDGVKSAATRLIGRGGGNDDGLNLTEDVKKAQSQMETVSEIIEDEQRTAFNIVTNAEEMALAETRRLHEQLENDGVHVGHIIANKVRIDVDEDCEYCLSQQQEQLSLLEETEENIGVNIHRIPSTPHMEDIERVDSIAENIPLPINDPEIQD